MPDLTPCQVGNLGLLVTLGVSVVFHVISAVKAWRLENRAYAERMSLFDKIITQGDAAKLYNLRVAEGVSNDKRTVENALQKEIAPPELDKLAEPWDDHPVYGSCDITVDVDRGVACVMDPDAVGGPDYWEEPLDVFMSKFGGESLPDILPLDIK